MSTSCPDSDQDGVCDDTDGCPDDAALTDPGPCGCGVDDVDGDGVCDDIDACPDDPEKTEAGLCGCNVQDSDGDTVCDDVDGCPDDIAKTEPLECGCGEPETDLDADGALDCNDDCPTDPDKILLGVCGCGAADVDTDGDGPLDCLESCPLDPLKVDPGLCGCGVSEVDTDGDLTPDCLDECVDDPAKVVEGDCGCGNSDADDDFTGIADCLEGCSDGEREGFTNGAYPDIAGCSGGFSEPGVLDIAVPVCGRVAGDDSANAVGLGCNIQDLCEVGWHVCDSTSDVDVSAGANGCDEVTDPLDPADLFFAARVSGTGGAWCESVGANDVFGCGNVGGSPDTATCAPLNRFSQDGCASIPRPPWDCAGSAIEEAHNVTHDGSAPGGALCCRD